MAIEKPAANAFEFLRAYRRDTVGRFLKIRMVLNETQFIWEYPQIEGVLNKATEKYFQRHIDEAKRYWGQLEVEEALNNLGVSKGLVTSETIREYEESVASPAVVKQEINPSL